MTAAKFATQLRGPHLLRTSLSRHTFRTVDDNSDNPYQAPWDDVEELTFVEESPQGSRIVVQPRDRFNDELVES